MENFTFFNPTRIEFGADKEQLIGQHLARHGVRKVLLCYGSERIKRDGLFDVVTQRLAEQGIAFVELGGIVSNPLLSTVRRASPWPAPSRSMPFSASAAVPCSTA
jgi:alcohol dehydrogenase YqhD (iron-dependent ADH family)